MGQYGQSLANKSKETYTPKPIQQVIPARKKLLNYYFKERLSSPRGVLFSPSKSSISNTEAI
jgi:hypothetical protein